MDQVIHDVAIQKLPVVIALDRSGFVGEGGGGRGGGGGGGEEEEGG